jgi:hypothetical protein
MKLRSIFPMSDRSPQSIIYDMNSSEITIRPAYADDQIALQRLASLDSAPTAPPHPLLVAEVEGELRVALSLSDGSAIADPFSPTAAILDLLHAHARTSNGRPRRARTSRAPSGAARGTRLRRRAPAWSR